MLRYLNEILTGNEESYVVDLWILFIVCYWIFHLFLGPENCKGRAHEYLLTFYVMEILQAIVTFWGRGVVLLTSFSLGKS